jgi:hypothetical protein
MRIIFLSTKEKRKKIMKKSTIELLQGTALYNQILKRFNESKKN